MSAWEPSTCSCLWWNLRVSVRNGHQPNNAHVALVKTSTLARAPAATNVTCSRNPFSMSRWQKWPSRESAQFSSAFADVQIDRDVDESHSSRRANRVHASAGCCTISQSGNKTAFKLMSLALLVMSQADAVTASAIPVRARAQITFLSFTVAFMPAANSNKCCLCSPLMHRCVTGTHEQATNA